jgi:hypothetical protein
MTKCNVIIRALLLAGVAICIAGSRGRYDPTAAGDPEPQNWLMNHRTHDGTVSPLDKISKDNVRIEILSVACSAAPRSTKPVRRRWSGRFMYIVDLWGIVYKIDALGEAGRIVWRMDPKQEKFASRTAVQVWGNFVAGTAIPAARDRD